MDARRTSRVIDPKIRHVGFFTPGPPPDRTHSGPAGPSSPPGSDISPSGHSLSPVMIPPPRHASDNLSRAVGVPVPRQRPSVDHVLVGSYNPPESVLGSSPVLSPSGQIVGDGEFSEDSANWIRPSDLGKFASSFLCGGFTLTAAPGAMTAQDASGNDKNGAVLAEVPNESRSSVRPLKDKASKAERLALRESQQSVKEIGGAAAEAPNESKTNSKPLKAKTTKAERRALQEAQRAAKAEGNKSHGGVASVHEQVGKTAKQPLQRKEGPQVTSSTAASEKKSADRPLEKDRKKDVPPPRMQFDDKNRVEKAKRRAVVKQTEAKNRVELFRHLPQYEYGTQLPNLALKFFQLDPMHPAVYTVGLQYLAGDITGANARCIAMLQAFQEAIRDYSTPPEKSLARDLTAKISSYVSFLIECRPLSISMGNAVRFLKAHIAKLPLTLSESEAKASLCSDIDRFLNEKIKLADKEIIRYAVTKIWDGDVLLTYGSSSVVEMILLYAHELRKQFRVVVVDSRPKLEGKALLRRLVNKGLSCSYTHINAVSYIMHEVTRVFLGAASVLSNGTIYSRVGTASVAMVAHAFRVPVLICCEAYKFHERVQLDSICSNELGDPDVVSKVPGRMNISHLDNLVSKENLQFLNVVYDVTPSDYISMIITDYGMDPQTEKTIVTDRKVGRLFEFSSLHIPYQSSPTPPLPVPSSTVAA